MRFLLLERLVLPASVLVQRALMWTWRTRGPSPAFVAEVAALPRVIFVIFHGTLFEALAFSRMWRAHGRKWMILTTPSLDGRLATSMLDRLRVGHAPLASGVRGVEGAREFIERVGAGEVGVVLADGPRGPRGIVKPGVPRTIAAARARVIAAGLASSRGVHFGSWDRTFLPAPFARVHVHCDLLAPTADGEAPDVAALQAAMDAALAAARASLAGPDDAADDRGALADPSAGCSPPRAADRAGRKSWR